MSEEPYPGYAFACAYWADVRSQPGFADAAAGKNIKLPPTPSPETRALMLLRGALRENPTLGPIVAELERIVANQRTQ